MREEILFSYKIEDAEIEVSALGMPLCYPMINEWFYIGAAQAIAEYLCYPYEVIAPRVARLPIFFQYDAAELKDIEMLCEDYIADCTREALLEYMEQSPENAARVIPPYATKPDISEERILRFCKKIREFAQDFPAQAEWLGEKSGGLEWIRFQSLAGEFYGRYRSIENSEYLLVSLPGYNAEWNDLSAYMDGSYDILAISPFGYNTPWGYDESKRVRGAWPVLYDTLCDIEEEKGYYSWVYEAASAVVRLKKRGQKLIFIGTSQGGGMSLILSSIFNDKTVACACEMPFFIGLSDKNYNKVRDFVANQMGEEKMIYNFHAKERLAAIVPMRHIGRLKADILLVSGDKDEECPSRDIKRLADALSCEKKFIELKNQGHGYTKEFKILAKEWIDRSVKKRT